MSSLTATSFLTDTKVASACAGKRVTICVPNEQKVALQSVEVLIKATGATEINKVYAVPDGNKTEVLIVLGAGFDTTVAAGCLVPGPDRPFPRTQTNLLMQSKPISMLCEFS